MSIGKYKLAPDVFWVVNPATGKRTSGFRGSEEPTLEDILDAIAECCGGYSCCRGGLITIDTVTGDKRLITSANGVTTNTLITD